MSLFLFFYPFHGQLHLLVTLQNDMMLTMQQHDPLIKFGCINVTITAQSTPEAILKKIYHVGNNGFTLILDKASLGSSARFVTHSMAETFLPSYSAQVESSDCLDTARHNSTPPSYVESTPSRPIGRSTILYSSSAKEYNFKIPRKGRPFVTLAITASDLPGASPVFVEGRPIKGTVSLILDKEDIFQDIKLRVCLFLVH